MDIFCMMSVEKERYTQFIMVDQRLSLLLEISSGKHHLLVILG